MAGRLLLPRLLVVDDEESIREILCVSLRFAGFEVYDAGDGLQALLLTEQLRPDLLVLDVLLPEIDGFTVAHRLRQQGWTVPVLFLSACDEATDRVQGMTAGGDDYLTKPFSLEEIQARVRSLLHRADAAG